MSKIRNYQDLVVWQRSMDLTRYVYQETLNFPKEERYGMISQMRRAAVSIPSNIAEGHSRNSTGEYRQQLGVASGAELETQLLLSKSLGYLQDETVFDLLEKCSEVGRLLGGLLRALRK